LNSCGGGGGGTGLSFAQRRKLAARLSIGKKLYFYRDNVRRRAHRRHGAQGRERVGGGRRRRRDQAQGRLALLRRLAPLADAAAPALGGALAVALSLRDAARLRPPRPPTLRPALKGRARAPNP